MCGRFNYPSSSKISNKFNFNLHRTALEKTLPTRLLPNLSAPFTHVALPIVRYRKWKKKSWLFERSEFPRLPIFCIAQLGTRRAATLRRLLLLTFLGEARKVSSCRATPRPTTLNIISGLKYTHPSRHKNLTHTNQKITFFGMKKTKSQTNNSAWLF